MTKREKNKLARLCGYSEERYTDLVREGVKKEFTLEDEVAILRKFCNRLLVCITEIHGSKIVDEITKEFKEYNEKIEAIKNKSRWIKEVDP